MDINNYSVEQLLTKASAMSLKELESTFIDSPDIVINHARAESAFGDVERLTVYFLNAKNRLIETSTTEGTVNQVVVYVREIVKKALFLPCTSIILVHNHPSGDCTPSAQDITITEKISEASALFDIAVMDHIIISKDSHFSFAEHKLM